MDDWSNHLGAALASGDPAYMKAALARVPISVFQSAIPYLEKLARNNFRDGKFDDSLIYYDRLLEAEPTNLGWRCERARVYFELNRPREAMADAEQIIEFAPEQALGYRLQAEAHDALRERPQAVAAYGKALTADPDDDKSKERIQILEAEIRKETMLRQALDPKSAQTTAQVDRPAPTSVTFDPVLFADGECIPESFDKPMVDALKQLLWRYSNHQSSKNALARIEDPVWLSAWDSALAVTIGSEVLLYGSELGTFALQALKHGATRALVVEPFPLDQRIASGIVQKHFLTAWHAHYGAVIQSWTAEERLASIEAFAQNIDIVSPDSTALNDSNCDHVVFPNIDHSLLGTGIVQAIRRLRARGLKACTRILPAKAKVFAMSIQWAYPSTTLRLNDVNRLRWSIYPQALELPEESWIALTESVQVGEIDFENFVETEWIAQLPIIADGNVDAVVFWFELNLGSAQISTAPGRGLECIKPAIQYTDAFPVESGQSMAVRIQITETRLQFHTQPPARQLRVHGLPNWYVPMLLDRYRNDVYRSALERALRFDSQRSVLDMGAGCGLLSMMAAQAGSDQVIGCEVNPSIHATGCDVVKANKLDNRVRLINKDCRNLSVPEDLPDRADLAVFEIFDCSLIGEGILHFVAYAREKLLKANARYIPMSAKIRAIVIEYRLERVWDIDVNLLNPYRFSPGFINVDARKLVYKALTEPTDLFSFDFSKATPAPEERELQIPAIAEGTAGAILFWFDLQLDETSWISNAPSATDPLHWKQGLQFLPEVDVKASTALPLVVKHDGSSLTFQWKPGALSSETLSKLPRFDPRSLAAINELDQQTRMLLQHCMQDAGVHTKVAELAKRFAIDPGRHGLDPTIAQRFVRTFFEA